MKKKTFTIKNSQFLYKPKHLIKNSKKTKAIALRVQQQRLKVRKINIIYT